MNVTKQMIRDFKIRKLKYDFMGYTFDKVSDLDYHHLIIPKKLGGPKTVGNGAILTRNCGHEYLHLIERNDRDRFLSLTKAMVYENVLGKLDMKCLKQIRDVLLSFEREYSGAKRNNGAPLIREEYVEKRIALK